MQNFAKLLPLKEITQLNYSIFSWQLILITYKRLKNREKKWYNKAG